MDHMQRIDTFKRNKSADIVVRRRSQSPEALCVRIRGMQLESDMLLRLYHAVVSS